jgi:hypothetical protein
MPLLHGGTPSCRRQPTSSWIHDIPGYFLSFSGGAPQPDCRLYAASSVLRPASLRRLPWGSPNAPLCTASFLDRAHSVSVASLQAVVSSNSDRTDCIAALTSQFTLDGLLQLRPDSIPAFRNFVTKYIYIYISSVHSAGLSDVRGAS